MWWKIAIVVICAIIVISPVDLSLAHFGIDDIGALVAMIASIVSAIKGYKLGRASKDSGDNYNDVGTN